MVRKGSPIGFQHKTFNTLTHLRWVHFLNDFFDLGDPRGTRDSAEKPSEFTPDESKVLYKNPSLSRCIINQ